MTEHPGEQFPPNVDPEVEPGFEPRRSEDEPEQPDYDTEPGPQGHVDPAEVEFGPEFARAPGEEHEHPYQADSVEDERPHQADSVEGEQAGEGHSLVEETVGRLEGLGERPVGEHAEVYADLHERLQSALVEADVEQGDRG